MKKICILLVVTLLAALFPMTSANAAFDVFTATLIGQMDMDVSRSVDEWGIGYLEDASVGFSINQEAIIFMLFDEPVKFTGNRVGIKTNIPVIGDTDASTTNARIVSFVVDGVELGGRDVPLVNRDGMGYMKLELAKAYNGAHDAYDFANMPPFSRLEITFIVPNLPEGIEDPIPEPEEVEEVEIVPIIEETPHDHTSPDEPERGIFRLWMAAAGVAMLALIFIGIKFCR